MRRLWILILCLLSTACAYDRSIIPPKARETPEAMYNFARKMLVEDREYSKAIVAFDEIDKEFPTSKWAKKSQVMLAFTHYIKREYDDAEIVLTRFLELYPADEVYTPYAYYLKAMCSYAQIHDPSRGQQKTKDAAVALKEIVDIFKGQEIGGKYADDAERKLQLTLDYIAGQEMIIGRFYQKNFNYGAALSRYENVVRDYQSTLVVPEALYRIAEVLYTLGHDSEAKKSIAVLGYNYPNDNWYKKATKLYEVKK